MDQTKNMENKKNSARAITIKELWGIFIQRLWVLILVAAIGVGVAYTVVQLTFVPQYESVATLYIMREDDDDSPSEKVQEYNLAIRVLYDCDYILKSHKVLDQVIVKLKNSEDPIDLTYGELRSSITISNPTDTRILEVKVVGDTPEEAKRTVDALCEIGTGSISTLMNEGQVTLYEYGLKSTSPCNKTGIMTFMLIGVAIAVGVYMIFVIAYMVDDRIKSDEDIENYFGLSVLGDIPDASEQQNKRYGSYRRYGAYKYRAYQYSAGASKKSGGESK